MGLCEARVGVLAIKRAAVRAGESWFLEKCPPSNLTPTHFLFSGDNILAVLRYLLMSEKLADSSEYRHGNMVFFDLLGVFVVAYPARVGTILNYMVAAATFLYLAKKASRPGHGGRSPPSGGMFPELPVVSFLAKHPGSCSIRSVSLSGGRYVRDLAYATGVALLSWLVTLLSVLIVALLVTLLGRSMFWYNHFYTSICLYGAAATGKIILIHTLAKNLYYGVSEVLNTSRAGRAPGSVPYVSIPL